MKMHILVAGAAALALATGATAATQKAYYGFNNTLAASVGGAPALASVDPASGNGYGSATVFGNNRTVFNFTGTNVPASEQGGLSLDTTGLVSSSNYSVVMVVRFDGRDNEWRRLIDVQNRQSDQGFYVDFDNSLDVYPDFLGAPGSFATGVFQQVVMTNGGGFVSAYLNGGLVFSVSSSVMDIANLDNPGNAMNFFLDNNAGSFQDEWSTGSVANIRLYDGVLSQGEVDKLWRDPFGAVPEPASWAMLVTGFGLTGAAIRQRRRRLTA